MEHYKNLDLADIKYFCDYDFIWKTEIWKDIPDYIGLYKVSDLGRVKSLHRQFGTTYYGANRFLKSRILKSRFNSHGYINFILCKDGKGKSINAHIAVAISFLNHKPSGYSKIIDHKDNVKTNNSLKNLQIITVRENVSKDKTSKSTFTGVYENKRDRNWSSIVKIKNKTIFLGNFKDVEIASMSYKVAVENITKYNGNNKEFRELINSLI